MHVFPANCRCYQYFVSPGVIAVLLPFIGSIISLGGSIVFAPLQFLYPPLIMLSTLAQQHYDNATWNEKSSEEETTLLQSNLSNSRSSRYNLIVLLQNRKMYQLPTTLIYSGKCLVTWHDALSITCSV